MPLLDKALASGTPGITRGMLAKKDCFVAYAPISTTNWSVLFALPVEAVFAPIVPTEKAILKQADTVKTQVMDKIRLSMLMLTLMFFSIIAAVYVVARRTAKLVTDPIMVLDEGARVIGDGNLDHRIEINSGDEIEELADTFNKMTADLKEYISNLTEALLPESVSRVSCRLRRISRKVFCPACFPPSLIVPNSMFSPQWMPRKRLVAISTISSSLTTPISVS